MLTQVWVMQHCVDGQKEVSCDVSILSHSGSV